MTDINNPVSIEQNKVVTILCDVPQEADCVRLVPVAKAAASNDTVSPTRVLRLPEVKARVGLCRASIYTHMAKGAFPKPISLGLRAVGWLEHEIDAWLSVRIQARGCDK